MERELGKSAGVHHNGAGNAPISEQSPRKKMKGKTVKSEKFKSLTKELEESRAQMAALQEALEKERAEKAAWKATADARKSSSSIAEQSSDDFDGAPRPSSTRRAESALNEESRFVSSVNQLGFIAKRPRVYTFGRR
ncbi:uncharacterized protein LOC134203887 [Armigeres subalbatus]|uniref:uncharacterized protein LOC134203887 n=1 Tax=Armigeres subalbatus TaxID=124917 RepID=UPI002ED2E49C